jgi:hypothetical protein
MAQKPKPSRRQPKNRSETLEAPAGEPVVHPEEIRASGEIQIGEYVNLKGTARVTPAGLICGGIAGVAILIAAAALVHVARR